MFEPDAPSFTPVVSIYLVVNESPKTGFLSEFKIICALIADANSSAVKRNFSGNKYVFIVSSFV